MQSIAKYVYIVLALIAVFVGWHFAADLIKAAFAGVIVALCLYGAYREWQVSKAVAPQAEQDVIKAVPPANKG